MLSSFLSVLPILIPSLCVLALLCVDTGLMISNLFSHSVDYLFTVLFLTDTEKHENYTEECNI
jgi:hypothetical protein